MNYLKIIILASMSIAVAACASSSATLRDDGVSETGIAYFRVKSGLGNYVLEIAKVADLNGATGEIKRTRVSRQALVYADADKFFDFKITGSPGRYVFESVTVNLPYTIYVTCLQSTYQFEIRENEVNYIGDFSVNGNVIANSSISEFDWLGRSADVNDAMIRENSKTSDATIINNTDISKTTFISEKGRCKNAFKTRS